MNNSLIHCIYSSAATAARDITGMLLYIEESFFQVLEGPTAGVDAVYGKIKTDLRHGRVTLIIREPILERSFRWGKSHDWWFGTAGMWTCMPMLMRRTLSTSQLGRHSTAKLVATTP